MFIYEEKLRKSSLLPSTSKGTLARVTGLETEFEKGRLCIGRMHLHTSSETKRPFCYDEPLVSKARLVCSNTMLLASTPTGVCIRVQTTGGARVTGSYPFVRLKAPSRPLQAPR